MDPRHLGVIVSRIVEVQIDLCPPPCERGVTPTLVLERSYNLPQKDGSS